MGTLWAQCRKHPIALLFPMSRSGKFGLLSKALFLDLWSICARNMTHCFALHVCCVPVIRVANVSLECASHSFYDIIQKGYFLHMSIILPVQVRCSIQLPSGNHQWHNNVVWGSTYRPFRAVIMCPVLLIFNCLRKNVFFSFVLFFSPQGLNDDIYSILLASACHIFTVIVTL